MNKNKISHDPHFITKLSKEIHQLVCDLLDSARNDIEKLRDEAS